MTGKIFDVIMIGAGPSSLTAAVYTTRENLDTVIYEKGAVGGLLTTIDKIDNYPGFPGGIEGYLLAEQFEKQAKEFGTVIEYGNVESIRDRGKYKTVTIDGVDIKARAVLIASGSSYRKLGIPGEAENFGKGVHFCATCDGAFYMGKKITVVGGGNSAVQESIFLTKFAAHIDLLVRDELTASEILQTELKKFEDLGKITIHLNTETAKIVARDGRVVAVEVKTDNKSSSINTDGVFVFIGLKPNTEYLNGSGVKLDKVGFVETNEKLETNIAGVFASGDVRSGSTKQVASAVGEGCMVAISIREYLSNQ